MQKHKQIISKLHHLRTIICINPLKDDASDLFDHMIRNLKKLRVLYLSFYNNIKLPESVGELKHLRYVNLARTSVSELPRSLCTLHHLQFLQLNYKVERLPDKLCNLSKLRHLRGCMDQISNIGKLTSLQHLNSFSVQKKQGYELRQLKDLNELGGSLTVKNLENAVGKDEALESKLYQKNRLKKLWLEWSSENGMDAADTSHLDILEDLRPSPELSGLSIKGYKSATYPRWLLDSSYFQNLESFELRGCTLLEGLPSDTELLRHCSRLCLQNVPKLKILPCFPVGLIELSIHGCPQLMFATRIEVEQHDLRENIMKTEHLESKLASLWDVNSGSYVRSVLSEEYSSLKHLMTQMDADISQHLQMIQSALEEGGDKVLVQEDIIKAWLFCHEQRIKFIYGRRAMELPLVLPSGLRELYLSSCSITDEALVVCLGGLTSLTRLSLNGNMALTALPSEQVFQHLTKLESLELNDCWCLRSLGGSRAAPSLSSLHCTGCPSLELARGAEVMALNLDSLYISGCILAADSFINGLPDLKSLCIASCRSSPSLSIGHLTSLESLHLSCLPDLCSLEGLSSLQLKSLTLVDVPNLTAKHISQFRVEDQLSVSSSVLLNHMLKSEGFIAPSQLFLEACKEPSVSFEEPASLTSVKRLGFYSCKMESLPTNLKLLSSLHSLDIYDCPNVTCLPDLPSSLQRINIQDCPVLAKNCRAPDGESWSKISHIRWKYIG